MTGDTSLLDLITRVSPGPVRHSHPQTARDAAARNAKHGPNQRTRCLLALVDAGERGLNSYELSVAAGIPRMHTAHTRCRELADAGLVVLTDERRPTDTGSDALIWQATPAGVAAARQMRGQ